jgi:ribosomal protein S18 acetylase RimI-like enzyme
LGAARNKCNQVEREDIVKEIRALTEADAPWLTTQMQALWGSPVMVSRGQIFDATMLPGLVALEDGAPVGLLLYHLEDGACEIVSLDSLRAGQGIGTALINAACQMAQQSACTRIWLITTNDNLPALGFYQKRGFHLVAVHANALELSRAFKPEIPEIGLGGIPLRDEIELEMPL